MDPSDKKWLKTYISELILKLPLKQQLILDEFANHDSINNYIHFYIHSTGLFYGYVSKQYITDFKSYQSWGYADRFKISLTEGFFLIYFYKHKERFQNINELESLIKEAAGKLFEFYMLFSIKDSFFVKNRELLTTSYKDYKPLEKIIDSRINNPSMLKKGFWKGSQFNVFTYIDLLYYNYWQENNYVYDRKNDIKKSILQIMIAASYAEGLLEKKEKHLVSYFLASGNFEEKEEELLLEQFEKGLYINSLHLDVELPYDIRLIMFENAVISVLSDTYLNNFEELFLGRLAEKLQILDYDTQFSIILIQNFIVQNNRYILYLHYKEGLDIITKSFTNRFQVFLQKNSSKIITEVSESKELLELLWKSKNEKLTEEEREKVKEQIIDLLKTIPSLAIFMIPGGSLLLPILIKILPEEIIMPSSFRNK
jgi:hypothetical protein